MEVTYRLGDIETRRGTVVKLKETGEIATVIERYFFGKFCILLEDGRQIWMYEDENKVEIINK